MMREWSRYCFHGKAKDNSTTEKVVNIGGRA